MSGEGAADPDPERRGPAHAEEEKGEFGAEVSSLFRIAVAPTIWAAHFLLSYAAVAVFCAKGGAGMDSILGFRLGVGGLGLVALGLIVWIGVESFREWNVDAGRDFREVAIDIVEEDEDRHEFMNHAALLLAVVSFVGVVYTALPVLVIGSCV